MLAHRLGRLHDIKSTLVQCIVFAGLLKVLSRLIPACASVLSTIGCCYCLLCVVDYLFLDQGKPQNE